MMMAGNGCEYDFNEVYTDNYPVVLRFLKYRLNHFQTAREIDDIIQDVFINVYRCFKDYRGDSKLSTWIISIALNVTFNYHRHLTRKVPLTVSDYDLEDPTSAVDEQIHNEITPERILNSQQIVLKLEQVLDKLDPVLRDALNLWIDDMPYGDIANHLSIPINTAKTRVFRARRYIEMEIKPMVDLYLK